MIAGLLYLIDLVRDVRAQRRRVARKRQAHLAALADRRWIAEVCGE